MFVITPRSKSQAATRCCARPWEVASRTQCVSPASTICARYDWISSASGVVTWKPVSSTRSPMTALTVLISPARTPEDCRMRWIRLQVVVLPSVPVTPIITIRRAGCPCQAAARCASVQRASGTWRYGTRGARVWPFAHEQRRSAAGGLRQEGAAIDRQARHGDKDRAGRHLTRIGGHARHFKVRQTAAFEFGDFGEQVVKAHDAFSGQRSALSRREELPGVLS